MTQSMHIDVFDSLMDLAEEEYRRIHDRNGDANSYARALFIEVVGRDEWYLVDVPRFQRERLEQALDLMPPDNYRLWRELDTYKVFCRTTAEVAILNLNLEVQPKELGRDRWVNRWG